MKSTFWAAALLGSSLLSAQTNWENVHITDEYKADVKLPGSMAKSFKKNPTFINDYTLVQSTVMKGRSQAGVMQKQGVGNVYSEAALGGVSEEALQKLVAECYAQFVTELKSIGLNITEGEEVMKGEYAEKKKDKENNVIAKADGQGEKEELGMMHPEGYDTRERYMFRPEGKNIFITTKKIPGTFYMKLAKAENINLMNVKYVVKFADFEGSKTKSRNTLTTSAGLTILPSINFTDPSGKYGWVAFKKPIEGNNDWSKGLEKVSSSDGSYLGFASSADYALTADETKYIAELKAIILKTQKDIVAELKKEME